MTSAVYSALLNASGTVTRATASYTSTGEQVSAWAEVGTVRCRLNRQGYANTGNFAMQGIVEIPTHKLFLEYEADVLVDDRVTVAGESYEVLEVFPPGGTTHHKEAYLRHV